MPGKDKGITMPFTTNLEKTYRTDMWEFDDSLSPEAKNLTKLLQKYSEDSPQFLAAKRQYEERGMHFIITKPEDPEQPPYVSRQTDRALALQALLRDDSVDAYEALLKEYLEQGYQFSLTSGVIHEQFSKRSDAGPDVARMQAAFRKSDKTEYIELKAQYASQGIHFIDVNGRIYERIKHRDPSTEAAKALQALIDEGDETAYEEKLHEYEQRNLLTFYRDEESGKVYQMVDDMEQGDCIIRFQVKNQVINWYFVSPKDQTTQEFRDRLYESAAIAHQHVDNGCETYYRGTNHYHIRAMHTAEKEADYNHNHYRTRKGSITPREVYQHLTALNATITPKGAKGEEFVDAATLKELTSRFTLYWAEYSEDVRYSMFLNFATLPTVDPDNAFAVAEALRQGERFMESMVFKLSGDGARFTPQQMNALLDSFVAPDEVGQIIPLKILQIYRPEATLETLQEYVAQTKELYLKHYKTQHADYVEAEDLVDDFEPFAVEAFNSSTLSPDKYSPRQRYIYARDQEFDAIDRVEFAVFSPRLIQACRSVTDHHLGELTPAKFRKAMLLYNILRVIKLDEENALLARPAELAEETIRIHDSVLSMKAVKDMIAKLPALQVDSTEDDIGETLLIELMTWLQEMPPEMEAFVEHVSQHGARGLGSAIADVRQLDGTVETTFANNTDTNPDIPVISYDRDGATVRAIMEGDVTAVETGPVIINAKKLAPLKAKLAIAITTVTRATGDNVDADVKKARIDFLSALIKFISEFPTSHSERYIMDALNSMRALESEFPRYKDALYTDDVHPVGRGPELYLRDFEEIAKQCLIEYKEQHVAIDEAQIRTQIKDVDAILRTFRELDDGSSAILAQKITVSEALLSTFREMLANPSGIDMSEVQAKLAKLCVDNPDFATTASPADGGDSLKSVIEASETMIEEALELIEEERSTFGI